MSKTVGRLWLYKWWTLSYSLDSKHVVKWKTLDPTKPCKICKKSEFQGEIWAFFVHDEFRWVYLVGKVFPKVTDERHMLEERGEIQSHAIQQTSFPSCWWHTHMQLMKMGRTCIHIGAVQLARLLQANRGQHHTRRLKLHRYGIGIPSACQRCDWGLEFHEAAKHVHKSITASSQVHKSKKKKKKKG